MSVATRRASLTPSSPAVSRRGSWVDVPVGSAPSSRRGSRVDLSINTSLNNTTKTSDPYTGPSQAKLAINQLLSNLSQVSESQARMSSPKGSRSPAISDSPSAKRKHEADTDSSTAFKLASASEIKLPADPLRRASIINLATAAAAAVLQSQVGQRRMSTHPEQEQKRQRVEHLGMLIEQARKASVGTMGHDISRHIETASQNVAIATVLANHLGLTPQSSAASTPSTGTPAPSSPTKAHASTLAVPATPTTPKRSLASSPLAAARVSDDNTFAQETAVSPSKAVVNDAQTHHRPLQASSPTSPTSTPSITVNNSEATEPCLPSKLPEWQSPGSSETLLEEAKEAAHTYSRFYRFEKQWAQKALELERRRSSIRIDPLFNPNPTLSPLAAEAHEDKSRAPCSPQQHSAPESRIMSRGTSPFGEFAAGPSSRAAHSVPSGSFSSTHRGSSSSLANVLSNYAELIEHRQRSCSGLEALAKQAKELPVKRLSQPNPQFRTTFGEFSWAKKPSVPRAAPVSHSINEGDANSDVSSPSRDGSVKAEAAPPKSAARPTPTHLQVKSEKKIKEEAELDGDAAATPRSTMSIASML